MSDIKWVCRRNGKWCTSNKSIDSDSDIGWIEVQDVRGRTIAMVTDEGGGTTLPAADAEMERRAHLIAAAPELYEALSAAMDFIESHVADPDITDEMAKAHLALQALKPNEVLAKARGAS